MRAGKRPDRHADDAALLAEPCSNNKKDTSLDPIIARLSASLPTAKTIEQLTRPLLDMLGSVTGLESTYLTHIDLHGQLQEVRYARNVGSLNIPEGTIVPWPDTLCKRALDEGRMATSNVAEVWGDSQAARDLGIATYVSAPIRASDGSLLGTLCAASSSERPIPPEAESVLKLFATLVASHIEREHTMQKLQQANQRLTAFALSDPLTGLPNRRALLDELTRLIARAVREHTCVLVGVIDLDGFKQINDSMGHGMGDEFLQQVARRLGAAERASDLLGRIGGDEFVVIGPGPTLLLADGELAPGAAIVQGEPLAAALALQQRLSAGTSGRYQLGDTSLDYAGASVGVVALECTGLTPEAAIQLADAQMYEVKRLRKGVA